MGSRMPIFSGRFRGVPLSSVPLAMRPSSGALCNRSPLYSRAGHVSLPTTTIGAGRGGVQPGRPRGMTVRGEWAGLKWSMLLPPPTYHLVSLTAVRHDVVFFVSHPVCVLRFNQVWQRIKMH